MANLYKPLNLFETIPLNFYENVEEDETKHEALIVPSILPMIDRFSVGKWRDFRDQKFATDEDDNFVVYEGEDEWLQSELHMYRRLNNIGIYGVEINKLLNH